MICQHCGTTLPPGALFCVECGRSIGEAAPTPSAAAPVASVIRPPAPAVPAAEAVVPPAAPADIPTPGSAHCPQCGTGAEPDDIFCTECGFVLRPITGTVELPSWAPESRRAATPVAPEQPVAAQHPLEDVESTRLVAAAPAEERFVLQFSTGESVVVSKGGLIGRNPAPEPGEFVDELIPIFDVGKSVSKSHIEFGQESGRFWVSDRYSTNGTVVRQPDASPVRCEPGKRYVIARGSRVEIGEQFFIVS